MIIFYLKNIKLIFQTNRTLMFSVGRVASTIKFGFCSIPQIPDFVIHDDRY